MGNPRGNPGNKGGGRKGYEFETQQMRRMKVLLNRFLTLAEKINSGKATDNQKESFDILKPLLIKIMDKIHASKQDIKAEIDKPTLIQGRDYGDN